MLHRLGLATHREPRTMASISSSENISGGSMNPGAQNVADTGFAIDMRTLRLGVSMSGRPGGPEAKSQVSRANRRAADGATIGHGAPE